MIITAWAAMSPHGTASEDLVRGGALLDGPRPVPDFIPREYLGQQGTRTMTRATALIVATTARLLAEDDHPVRTGLVIGTTNGNAQSILEVNRASLTAAKPFHIQPTGILNAAMNSAASQTAIWHRLKGPNVTLAGGRATGLLAIGYCRRLLLSGRADVVLAGAAEELTEARAWTRDGTSPHAEGCAVLRLERETTGLAEVVAVTSAFATNMATAVTMAARRALARAAANPADVAMVLSSGEEGDAEAKAMAKLCPTAAPLPPLTASLGQLHAATGAFQLASMLSRPCLGLALLTAVDPDGVAAAVVLRLEGASIVA